MSLRNRWAFLVLVVAVLANASLASAAEPMKVGIIGLDTSHVVAFTSAIQKASPESELYGLQVVAAFPGGSKDVENSYTRIDGFTQKLREAGVEIVGSINELLPKVDAVLLESVDGRPHLEQAKPLFAANKTAEKKKPLFIDKPIAASLADTLEIFRLAEESGTPVFSSSSLRYYEGIAAVDKDKKFGDIIGCLTFGPCSLEPHHPDLFWYGIHGVEILFTIMGPGCESVTCTATPDTHVVTGVWKGGRVATFRGIRSGKGGYEPLLVEVAKFFRTGRPPVEASETIELVAFMQAADESKARGGASVTLAEVHEATKKAAK